MREIGTVSPDILQRFPRQSPTKYEGDLPDFWAESNDGIRSDHRYLIAKVAEWPPCIEGNGGDKQMFKAACFLARHGVTGWDAVNLLELVEQVPPFDELELQHKVESAWLTTHAEGEFGVQGLDVFDEQPASSQDDLATLQAVRAALSVKTAAELRDVEEPAFAVERLLVDKDTLIIGGREKSFKTGLAFDLAISLATGLPFLGKFPIAKSQRVAVFTAEIGESAIRGWVDRVCREKEVDPIIDSLLVSASLPNFQLDKNGRPVDFKALELLRKFLEYDSVDVAVFDPLYFALLGTSLGDMNAVGGVLRTISELCHDCGVWPILCHHARKDSAKDFQPMALGDLSGSGVPAFARQWLLSAHAEPFEDGRASLFVRAGGSNAGDRGLWRVNIEEGIHDEIADRRWSVSVSSEEEFDSQAGAREAILDALRQIGRLETVSTIALHAGVSSSIARDVLGQLAREQLADLENSKFRLSVGVE